MNAVLKAVKSRARMAGAGPVIGSNSPKPSRAGSGPAPITSPKSRHIGEAELASRLLKRGLNLYNRDPEKARMYRDRNMALATYLGRGE